MHFGMASSVEENKRFRFTMSDDVQIPEFIGYTEKFQLLILVFSNFFSFGLNFIITNFFLFDFEICFVMHHCLIQRWSI